MSNEPRPTFDVETVDRERHLVEQRLQRVQAQYAESASERRELITLASRLGMPVRLIASIIDESPSTVASWVRRSRKPVQEW